VFDFIDQAVGCDDRRLLEMLTGGEKHYFRFCPRNPVPYCRSETMVQYLLKMGADPEYWGVKGVTLREYAIRIGHQGIVALLNGVGNRSPEQSGQAVIFVEDQVVDAWDDLEDAESGDDSDLEKISDGYESSYYD
jgi:hypothetical protein